MIQERPISHEKGREKFSLPKRCVSNPFEGKGVGCPKGKKVVYQFLDWKKRGRYYCHLPGEGFPRRKETRLKGDGRGCCIHVWGRRVRLISALEEFLKKDEAYETCTILKWYEGRSVRNLDGRSGERGYAIRGGGSQTNPKNGSSSPTS